MTLIEVCVETPEAAELAQEHGADRVELCTALELGGLTPSAATISRSCGGLPVNVLIRPRAGGFVYAGSEIRWMADDVSRAIDEGAAGVVVGALTAAGEIDEAAMEILGRFADDVPITFHRAFDSVADPIASAHLLVGLGVRRVLTSGGRPTAPEGADTLARLVAEVGDDLEIIAGGGVRPDNIAALLAATAVPAIHFSATVPVDDPAVGMPVLARRRVDAELLRHSIDAVRRFDADR